MLAKLDGNKIIQCAKSASCHALLHVHNIYIPSLWLPYVVVGRPIMFYSCDLFIIYLFIYYFSHSNLWDQSAASRDLCCRPTPYIFRAENTGRKKSSGICHLGTIAQLYWAISLQVRYVSTVGKKLVKQQYLLHIFPKYDELRPTSGWDWSGSLGHPRVISTGFASWQRYCTLCQQWASTKLCSVEQRVPHIFGRAAITLGIGPHSSFFPMLAYPVGPGREAVKWVSVCLLVQLNMKISMEMIVFFVQHNL